jgi:hypothetical protein
MRVIKVYPVVWFSGAWKTLEATATHCPIFPWPNGRQKAIDHARCQFSDAAGEIHIYDDDGASVIETLQIDSRTSMSRKATLCVP